MPYISKIKLNPTGSAYDIRDNAAEHFIGWVADGSIPMDGSVVSATSIYTIPEDPTPTTVPITDIKVEDVVATISGRHQFICLLDEDGTTKRWWKITPNADVHDVKVDTASILDPADSVAKLTTTGQYDGDSASQTYNPLATKKYVDDAIEELPQAIIFCGTLGLAADGGMIQELPTAAAGVAGYEYKVVTAGTYASQAAKVGDLFICARTGGDDLDPTYGWVLIPSGDEPDGTVTGVTVGTGMGALDATTGSTTTITTSGSISLKIGDTAFSSAATIDANPTKLAEVTTDSAGNLAVGIDKHDMYPNMDQTNPYSETAGSLNPVATVGTVTAALGDLGYDSDDETVHGNAGNTLTKITQTNGLIEATFAPIEIENSQISDITRNGAVNGFAAQTTVVGSVNTTAGETAADVNIAYVTMGGTGEEETLIFTPIWSHSVTTDTALTRILQDNSTPTP